ncbi:SdiA-regulated domain-containing protein [Pseudomonas simiae]|jgi:uncharacterized protein YjiK|uniref:SdiA-regulated domain-containing protein n=1 Tax=Pseudomonas simiae TaxID=321846 RepID=UPI0005D99C69|nr:SdiA-regulated domain-containing protein [Pseudomonas simiae]MBD8741118.1 SdiA-regulated domain-containing protein [Pseudomonas fluorescens]PHX39335.1 hypothetical protein AO284_37990 [Pseudomonas sp. NZIPFR-PS2]AJZ97387.1 hypothetical protein PFLUOLIPICF7_22245 [Pseudomonas simiae]MBC3962622.1 SdiA-regulated domain-containing protein [Pseudomonas simiae]TKK04021.1 hypothetical protein PflCFBP13514_14315 [Pseudomonas fluorescens]
MNKRSTVGHKRPAPRRGFSFVWKSVVALLIIILFQYSKMADTLAQNWHAITTSTQLRNHSVWLPDYRFVQRVELPGIDVNASDIVYVAALRSYFVLVNSPAQLYEYAEDFTFKARYELAGFQDPEAIAYDGHGNLLIGEERRQSVVTLPLTVLDKPIARSNLHVVSLDTSAHNNRGLEGIAFDPESQVLFASREDKPMRLYEVAGITTSPDQLQSPQLDQTVAPYLTIRRLRVSDISALHYDRQTQHLLVLSDQSGLLVELDSAYGKVSYMKLAGGLNGLDQSVPQAEGVTLGPNREIILVSEPNLLYRYVSDDLRSLN